MKISGYASEIEPDLLARARAGEQTALSALYRSLSPRVYSLGLRMLQNPAEAEEVLQDTFVEAFRKLQQYRGDAPFWYWLRQVAVNKALSRIRQRKNWASVLETVTEDAGPTADPATELDLERALARLPAVTRSVLLLHDVEQYTHREIGDLMGKSESFSKSTPLTLPRKQNAVGLAMGTIKQTIKRRQTP